MTEERTILVAGTWDTKNDELGYMADVIRAQGGRVMTMDVSVLHCSRPFNRHTRFLWFRCMQ